MSTTAYAPKSSGWLTFAAIILAAVGFFRLISGIAYFADSVRVNDVSNGLFGDNLFWWGIWDLAIAALALYAAYSLLGNNEFGRVVGYIWAILVIVQSFLLITWAPWFAFGAIVLAVLVIWALATTAEPSST
jgi:hypothetical protein